MPRYRKRPVVIEAFRFMQLNPARGRKLQRATAASSPALGLCSSTPRGDGNQCSVLGARVLFHGVYAAQPREGTETAMMMRHRYLILWFMQLNPARGRKLRRRIHHATAETSRGLCSSTPRGDGNPRRILGSSTRRRRWFMQLNPARGRKLMPQLSSYLAMPKGLCSSTPRGDGNVSISSGSLMP